MGYRDNSQAWLNIGNSLGSIIGSVANWDRNKKLRALQDQALEFSVSNAPKEAARKQQETGLKGLRLDFDRLKQTQDLDLNNRQLADRGVQRKFNAEQTDLGGLNPLMPGASYIMRGGDPQVVQNLMHQRVGYEGRLSGTKAGAAANAKAAVGSREDFRKLVGKWALDPENAEVPTTELTKRLHERLGTQGRAVLPPAGKLSEGEWQNREFLKSKGSIFRNALGNEDKLEAINSDPQLKTEFEAWKQNMMRAGKAPGAQAPRVPQVQAPVVATPSAAPNAEATKQAALAAATKLGIQTDNPAEWSDEEEAAVMQAIGM